MNSEFDFEVDVLVEAFSDDEAKKLAPKDLKSNFPDENWLAGKGVKGRWNNRQGKSLNPSIDTTRTAKQVDIGSNSTTTNSAKMLPIIKRLQPLAIDAWATFIADKFPFSKDLILNNTNWKLSGNSLGASFQTLNAKWDSTKQVWNFL